MTLTPEQVRERRVSGISGFYFTGADAIRVTSYNTAAGAVVTASGRFLALERIEPADFHCPHTPNTDRTAASTEYALGEGWLQSVSVVASSGAPVLGQTFVRVDVIRGRGASASVVATLLQGFVTAGQRLAWPGSTLVDSLTGPGRIRSITGTDPAAGAEMSETVPAGARWRLLHLNITLLTDATVSNREVRVILDDGTAQYFESGATAVIAASSSVAITLWRGSFLPSLSSTVRGLNAPEYMMLLAGHRIRTETSNLQAADNYAAPQLLVEEWLEGS